MPETLLEARALHGKVLQMQLFLNGPMYPNPSYAASQT